MSFQESRPEQKNQSPLYLADATLAVAALMQSKRATDSCAVFGATDDRAAERLSEDIGSVAAVCYRMPVYEFEFIPEEHKTAQELQEIKNFQSISKGNGLVIVKNLDSILLSREDRKYEQIRKQTAQFLTRLLAGQDDSYQPPTSGLKVCAITKLKDPEEIRSFMPSSDVDAEELLKTIRFKHELTHQIQPEDARDILLAKGPYDEDTVHLPILELAKEGRLTHQSVTADVPDHQVARFLEKMRPVQRSTSTARV